MVTDGFQEVNINLISVIIIKGYPHLIIGTVHTEFLIGLDKITIRFITNYGFAPLIFFVYAFLKFVEFLTTIIGKD